MAGLGNPMFWETAENRLGVLQKDRGMHYMLLDTSFTMLPLIRNDSDKTFSQFLLSDANAQKCKIAINGGFFGLGMGSKSRLARGHVLAPDDVDVEGQVVQAGKVIVGDSRPIVSGLGN